MKEVQDEVRTAAMHRFESFANQKLPDMPLFKQVGMQMVLFGAREPKLYQLLFMQENRNACLLYTSRCVYETGIQRLENRIKYYKDADRKKRTHRLCTVAGLSLIHI